MSSAERKKSPSESFAILVPALILLGAALLGYIGPLPCHPFSSLILTKQKVHADWKKKSQ
jgi:hypothetical protein